jgi:hypothetical protein
MRKGSARVGAALALALVGAAQISWAQTPPQKKKKAHDPTPAVDVDVAVTPTPTPPPAEVSVAVSPVADASSKTATASAIASNPGADESKGTETDVFEKGGERYIFIGARYRGTIIPKAFENIFVAGGATIYSNSVGIEADIRKDAFSLIPAISYTSYGTGDILFLQKNEADIPGNWSVVNSSLSAIYLTADLLWSVKLAPTVDFEIGAGFGLGILFGSLEDNWVSQATATTPGALAGGNGNYYVACTTANGNLAQSGCRPGDHTSPTPAKINGYNEPFWTGGGSVPNIFPHISIPQIGLRFKPIKQLEGRIGVGFSITGVWFGASADYGFETPEKK